MAEIIQNETPSPKKEQEQTVANDDNSNDSNETTTQDNINNNNRVDKTKSPSLTHSMTDESSTSSSTQSSSTRNDNNRYSNGHGSLLPSYSLSPLSIPWLPVHHFHKQTGLVHCVVQRIPSTNILKRRIRRHQDDRWVMFLQQQQVQDHDENNHSTTAATRIIPLLMAQRSKDSSFSFQIYDISTIRNITAANDTTEEDPYDYHCTMNPRYLGHLLRRKEASCIGYALYQGKPEHVTQQVASIWYPATPILGVIGPRKAHMAIYNSGLESPSTTTSETSACEPKQQHQEQQRDDPHDDPKSDRDMWNMEAGLHVFESKRSRAMSHYTNKKKKSNQVLPFQPFQGRCRIPSSKNMQMVYGDGDSKDVVLQMGKWSNGKGKDDDGSHGSGESFHVDFKNPLTAAQAFGFALAQLDL